MIERWADKLPERRTLLAFIEWCQKRRKTHGSLGIEVELSVVDLGPALLDEYHGINQRQLDDERRQLLEQGPK